MNSRLGHLPAGVVRRLTLASVAAVVGLAVISVIGPREDEASRTNVSASPSAKPSITRVSASTRWRTHRVQALEMHIDVPDTWFVQSFEVSCRIVRTGMIVSNMDHAFRVPDIFPNCTSRWDMRGLPDDLVVIDVSHFEGGPSPSPASDPDTEFPLSLDDADTLSIDAADAFGAPQPYLDLPFQVSRDNRYSVLVWMGPEVSVAERRVAERIVSSISISDG